MSEEEIKNKIVKELPLKPTLHSSGFKLPRFSFLSELALKGALFKDKQAEEVTKKVITGWANWYMNRCYVFEKGGINYGDRVIEFQNNLQWMGDQMSQQLGALKKDIKNKEYWNKANNFAKEVWLIGNKYLNQNEKLQANSEPHKEFFKHCINILEIAKDLMEN